MFILHLLFYLLMSFCIPQSILSDLHYNLQELSLLPSLWILLQVLLFLLYSGIKFFIQYFFGFP